MTRKPLALSVGRAFVYGAGVVGAAYAAYAATTWLRYGHVRTARDGEVDTLLDRFMPTYDVAERHKIRVAAPSDITFAALCDTDPRDSAIVRAIFKGRELALGARPDGSIRPRGLVALTKSIGWRVLAEIPGREIVMGSVTRPWEADVTFRPIGPDAFTAFAEPDYVKIVWTLRADAKGGGESIARTETRVATTDRAARAKFRRYWSMFSPGILLIRRVLLQLAKAAAERRANERGSAAD